MENVAYFKPSTHVRVQESPDMDHTYPVVNGRKRPRPTELANLIAFWNEVEETDPMRPRKHPRLVEEVEATGASDATDRPESQPDGKRASENRSSNKSDDSGDDSNTDLTQSALDVVFRHGSDYLDMASLTRYRLSDKANYGDVGRRALERRVCRYFMLTTDIRKAAGRVVDGGWDTFVGFLAHLGHQIQTAFAELGLTDPPKLYRAAMAQQAIRRIDGSPHPLLFDSMWKPADAGVRTEWAYEEKEERNGGYNADVESDANGDPSASTDGNTDPANTKHLLRKPTMELCFGQRMHSDSSAVSEHGWLLPPRYEDKLDEKMQSLLRQHVAWVASNSREGSLRRKLAEARKPPYIFIAQDGCDSYRTFWVLTLDDDDEVCCKYLFPYEEGTADKPFRETDLGSNLSKWLVTSSCEDTHAWDMERTNPVNILGWSLMAKSLGVPPFATAFDLHKSKECLEREGQLRYHPLPSTSDVDPAEEADRIWNYLGKLELIYND